MTVLFSLASVVLVSLISLIGLFTISMDEGRLRRLATSSISFAVGALLGDAFIHLIPEVFAGASVPATSLRQSLLVLAGMMSFFVVEKLLRHSHGVLHAHHHGGQAHPELTTINVIGDAIHNYIDGLLIGGSYLVSPEVGLSTTLAVLLHELPQELGDFGILIHGGLSARTATLVNLASASVAIAGTLTALLVGSIARESFTAILLPMTAGGFVYLATADLIPELQHDRSLQALAVQSLLIVAGIGVMSVLTLVD